MKQTARFAGQSAYTNAVLSVLFLTDALLRTEQKMKEMFTEKQGTEQKVQPSRKNPMKGKDQETGQVSVWDLLD